MADCVAALLEAGTVAVCVDGNKVGTGTVLPGGRAVLTCYHVLPTGEERKVTVAQRGHERDVVEIWIPAALEDDSTPVPNREDLALLYIEEPFSGSKVLQWSQFPLVVGCAVAFYGYRVREEHAEYQNTHVAGAFDNARGAYPLTAAPAIGTSGAPVVDAHGRIVGVVVSRSRDVPQRGYAVPSSVVRRKLQARLQFDISEVALATEVESLGLPSYRASAVPVTRAVPMEDLRPEDRLARIYEKRQITFGCVKHPPLSDFEWHGNEVAVSGYYIELARVLAESNGLSLCFLAVDWSELETIFEDQPELDAILSVFETRARCRAADFTAAFHRVGVGAIGRADNRVVQSLQDLRKGRGRAAVSRGEIGWEIAVHELKLPKRQLIILDDADLTSLIDLVVSKRADLAICDEVTCQRMAAADPQIRSIFGEDPLYLCKNSVMLPQGQPRLRDWLQEQLGAARETGELEAIEERLLAEHHPYIRRFL